MALSLASGRHHPVCKGGETLRVVRRPRPHASRITRVLSLDCWKESFVRWIGDSSLTIWTSWSPVASWMNVDSVILMLSAFASCPFFSNVHCAVGDRSRPAVLSQRKFAALPLPRTASTCPRPGTSLSGIWPTHLGSYVALLYGARRNSDIYGFSCNCACLQLEVYRSLTLVCCLLRLERPYLFIQASRSV